MKVQHLIEDRHDDSFIKKLLLDVQRWVIENDPSGFDSTDPELDYDEKSGRFQLEYTLANNDEVCGTVFVAIDQDDLNQALIVIDSTLEEDPMSERCNANIHDITNAIESLYNKLYELMQDGGEDSYN